MPESLINLVQTPGDAALITFHICLATASVVSNLLLLLALLHSSAVLKSNHHLYTLSITISDLVVGAGWFYLALYEASGTFGSFFSPEKVLSTIHGISLVALLAAMVDRYLAVQYPFRYIQKVTRTKVLILIGFVWFWPIVTIIIQGVIPGKGGLTYQGYSTIIFSILMLGIMVILNARLYAVIRRQQEREPQADGGARHNSASLIVVASTLFIVLWLPNIAHVCTCFAFKLCLIISNNATNPFAILRMANTLTTPLIFLFGSPTTRDSVKTLVRRLKFKR